MVLALAVASVAGATPAVGLPSVYMTEVTFSRDDLMIVERGGYDEVRLDGLVWPGGGSGPCLPVMPLKISLPGGCDLRGFRIAYCESIQIGDGFDLLPCPQLRSLSGAWGTGSNGEATTEASSAMTAEITGWLPGSSRTICEILIRPVRYRPGSGNLILYTDLRLEIAYETSGCDPASASIAARRFPKTRVWDARRRLTHDAPLTHLEEPIDYLIVTSSNLAPGFEPLLNWKMRKGLKVALVTIEEITCAYGGVDLAEKIRNCIADFKRTCSTRWVLLGGDSEIIPARLAYVPVSDQPYLPCDLYYADLDGSWNGDGDLLWGEVADDSVDMYSDVYVGRAPVSTQADVEVFVEKVLTYEGCQGGTDFAESLLFVGEVLWGDPANPEDPDFTDGGRSKDLLDSLCLPDAIEPIKLYETRGNLNRSALLAWLECGVNLINLVCHGTYGSLSIGDDFLTAGDFESLTNAPRYGLLYATSCHAGGFDQADCIGEAWVLSSSGGGFFLGNSRYGFNLPGYPGEGPSDRLDQAFFNELFNDSTVRIGRAHARARDEYVPLARQDNYFRYVIYGLNLLADPETSLWLEMPETLEIAHPQAATIGENTFTITVSHQGLPLAGATVCLWKQDEFHLVDSTDVLGCANFTFEVARPGTVLVTVTLASFLPYLGNVVACECPSSSSAVTSEYSDQSGRSPGERMALEVRSRAGVIEIRCSGIGEAEPSLSIYDVTGRRIGKPVCHPYGDTWLGIWDGSGSEGERLPPGIYFVRLAAGRVTLTRKILLIR